MTARQEGQLSTQGCRSGDRSRSWGRRPRRGQNCPISAGLKVENIPPATQFSHPVPEPGQARRQANQRGLLGRRRWRERSRQGLRAAVAVSALSGLKPLRPGQALPPQRRRGPVRHRAPRCVCGASPQPPSRLSSGLPRGWSGLSIRLTRGVVLLLRCRCGPKGAVHPDLRICSQSPVTQ